MDRYKRTLTQPMLIALGVITALWALFFWRLLTPDPANRIVFVRGDFTEHFYPFVSYAADRIWQGQLPLWNPYNNAGTPFMAHVFQSPWYPLQWLAILLAGRGGFSLEAYQLLVAGHIWLAAVLTFAFLRVEGLQPGAALVGGVMFAFGGFLTSYPLLQPSIMMTAVWLPLLLIGIRKSVEADGGWRVGGMLLAGGAAALAFLGGLTQITMYVVYSGLAYLAFAGWRAGLRWQGVLWRAALMGVVGAGLAAVQIGPTLQAFSASTRVGGAYAENATGYAPLELLGLLWSQPGGSWSALYVGAAGILLAAGALLRPKVEHRFWGVVIAVGLLLSLGGHAALYDLFYNVVPGFEIFRQQERITLLVSFGLSVLAAYQVDWLLGNPPLTARRGQARLAWGYTALTGLIAVAYLTYRRVAPDSVALFELVNTYARLTLIGVLFAAWAAWVRRRAEQGPLAVSMLIALLAVDLFSVGMRLDNYQPDTAENRPRPPGGVQAMQPDGPVLWRVDAAAGVQGYTVYYRIPDIYNTGPMPNASVQALLELPVHRFWEVLAVRVVTIPADLVPPVPADSLGEHVNYSSEPYTVYRLDDPRPFAHLVYHARAAEGSAEYARQIMADPRVDLREIAVTLYPPPVDLSGARPAGADVSVARPRPERLEIRVDTPEPAILTIAIPKYPGWRATVDGERVPIIDTYAGLLGVPLAAGADQQVVLYYRPRLVMLGGGISALTLLGVLVAGGWSAWRERTGGARRNGDKWRRVQ